MDQDLSPITKNQKPNLFFKELSDSLTDSGFHVFRYNKRNFQLQSQIQKDPNVAKGPFAQAYRGNPMRFLVSDVLDAVHYCQDLHPQANIHLIGHSEGVYVALQAAHQEKAIKGVGLIGFSIYNTDMLVFEQTVYRPLGDFHLLDSDQNQRLDQTELSKESPMAAALSKSLKQLDHNGDGQLSMPEYMAAHFSNLLVIDQFSYTRQQEAQYPRIAEILKEASFKVAIFQGLLDNQTPAYHAMAMEMLLKQTGKIQNKRFHYFPDLGHALDKRKNYYDLTYDTIASSAKVKLVEVLDSFFSSPSTKQGE